MPCQRAKVWAPRAVCWPGIRQQRPRCAELEALNTALPELDCAHRCR
ncbi:hypothetical protein [Nonomuraea sp. NPDC052265]